MSDTLDLMIADVRSDLNEPTGVGHATDSEIAKAINKAQKYLASIITAHDAAFFEEEDTSLGFVNGTKEYDLPVVCRNRPISKVRRSDLDPPAPIMPIRFQQSDEILDSTFWYMNGRPSGWFYYLRGQKIGIVPIPDVTVANNLKINYVQLPHDLIYAGAKTPTTTTITFPTATTAPEPYIHAGRISTEPNYYVNAKIRILAGTAKGLELKITAWDAATLIATVTPTMTAGQVAAITNQPFVILSPLRDEYKQAMVDYAVMKMGQKKKMPDIIAIASENWKRVVQLIEDTADLRKLDEPVYVEPPADFEGDPCGG